MTKNMNSENQALLDFASEHTNGHFETQNGATFFIQGYMSRDVTKEIERYQSSPNRAQGLYQAHTLDDLVSMTDRLISEDGSASFYVDAKKGEVWSILNEAIDGNPQWGDFRIKMDLEYSADFKEWKSQNKQLLSIQDFVGHITSMAHTLVDEPFIHEAKTPGQAFLKTMTERFKGKIATPDRMLDMASSLEVRQNANVRAAFNQQSGERAMVFTEEHTDANGDKLSVPNYFFVELEVFKGAPPFMFMVALGYRIRNNQAYWAYDLLRLEKAVDTAREDFCAALRERAEERHAVFQGAPR